MLPLQLDKLQFSNVPKKKACTKANPYAAFKIQYVKTPPSIKINFWCPYTFLPIFWSLFFSSVCQKYTVSIYHTKKGVPLYGVFFFWMIPFPLSTPTLVALVLVWKTESYKIKNPQQLWWLQTKETLIEKRPDKSVQEGHNLNQCVSHYVYLLKSRILKYSAVCIVSNSISLDGRTSMCT